MAIVLNTEQERVLIKAVDSGLAHSTEEALDQALESLKSRLPHNESCADESVAAAARRLAMFGKRNGLSLGGMTIRELLRESRP